MPPSLNVFWKELLSFYRDRRTLFSQILLPLFLMPFFMFAPAYLMDRLGEQTAAEVQKVAAKGIPEELEKALKDAGLLVIEDPDPAQAVRTGRADAGLIYDGRRFTLYLKLAQEGMRAEVLRAKIQAVLDRYKAGLIERRLHQAGLDPKVLEPFSVEVADVSPPKAQGTSVFAYLVPMLLLMFVLTGAMPVVLDATAGEKERGTLEVLLAAPTTPWAILLGKAGAAMVAALLSTASGVLGLFLGGAVVAQRMASAEPEAFSFRLGTEALFAILVTGVLFAALAVGAMIFLALLARSYREAQTYVGFLYMALLLPAFSAGMVSSFFEPTPGLYLIPVAGPMLFLDAVFRAKADLLAYLLAWGSTLFYAALALGLAAWAFGREEIVFKN